LSVPNNVLDHGLVSAAWSYMSSDDMLLNLTSELISIIVTLILVTMLGGWIVRRSASRSFEKKWAAFRTDLASSILEKQKELDLDYFYLGKDMIRISEKPIAEINGKDLEAFRRKRIACQSHGSDLLAFFERSHFALRARDIAPASKYISALRAEILQNLSNGFSSFEQFETRLTMHLQGLVLLQSYIGNDHGPTYMDVLQSSAKEADRLISSTDRAAVLRLGRELADRLNG